MTERTRAFSDWLLPVGLGVLVVVLVVVALTRGPVELDPDTPEGTVQEYLLAIDEGRWDDAVAVIHPDWLGECDGEDLSRFAQGDFTAELGAPGEFGGGIVREEFTVIGDDLGEPLPASDETVEVTIRHTGTGGVFGAGWDEYVIFEMSDDGEFWWIVSDPWPYFVWNCRE
ncbi:MAG: hypothetical protein PVJ28_01870 [Acidimicrobiia bacterium]|jgi:hypothetical protein